LLIIPLFAPFSVAAPQTPHSKQTQILEAERMAAEWKSRHPDPLRDLVLKEPPKSCPITKPPAHPFVPPYPAEVYPGNFWFGSEKLWINLPADGTWKGLPHYRPTDTAFRQKLLWWHKGFDGRNDLEPTLKVSGKRLDSTAPIFKVEESANTYGGPDSRFLVVGIDIPTLGCWEIKGVFGAAELSFVIWVTQ